MNARAIALDILIQVIVEGRSLNTCLREASIIPLISGNYSKGIPAFVGMTETNKLDKSHSSFTQALCYGVCRSFFRLDFLLKQLMDKPLKQKDQDIYCLLLMGIYQLSEMRVATHAAVSETVSLVKHLKKDWARGLVNAVLRNFERRKEALLAALDKNFSAKFSHPQWMIDKIKKDYPENWKDILAANNAHPPFALRVNVRQNTREQYLALNFSSQDIPANKSQDDGMSDSVQNIAYTQSGIILKTPVDVHKVPGFSEGKISVQDGAAQLAVGLLQLEKNQNVLDACAAPGGKTAHILETAEVELIAIDKDPKRLTSITENLSRLQLHAKCIAADVAEVSEWWDGRLFDRILLDAPCSASGVIRRHPDIKLLRQDTDIAKLALEQKRLLQALWPLLKPNGILVYVTCSIFSDENVAVIADFLQKTSDAQEEKIEENWGCARHYGRQVLPGMDEMDGFYFCTLRKAS